MGELKPLQSTQRTISWEELPVQVRAIPEGHNPLDQGVFMKHQIAWAKFWIRFSLAVVKKGRRTGITYATAMQLAITISSRRSAGGDNVYYIGDTKEKGLEFIGYMAHMLRVMASAQKQLDISEIEEFIFEDQDEEGKTRHINAYRIRTASGFQVVALSSRPANIRGLQGIVVIDEAAFHQDVQGVLDAATALLIWGGRIIVISTHNGTKNPFNQLIKDIENGLYGDQAGVFTITFDQAVENGLYERVCLMKGKKATAEGKEKWYKTIRNSYGPRTSAMREELDVIPRDGGGASIPGVWIENVMKEYRPILRWSLGDDFAAKSDLERRELCDAWIKKYLDPLLKKLDPTREHVFGSDYARYKDFAIFTPAEITLSLKRDVPFIIELHNVPTRQQEQILWHMIDGLPRFVGGAMDASGPGMTLAEYTADKYGRPRIAEVMLSIKWYAENMPKLVGAFEDEMIGLPRDADIESDLRSVVDVDGIPRVPTVRIQDIKEPELFRHGDAAIALAMMWFASLHKSVPADYVTDKKEEPSLGFLSEGESLNHNTFIGGGYGR